MPDSFVSTNIKMKKPDWYPSIRRYEQSHLWKAIWQLLNTFIPYFLVCILMYLSLKAGYSYLVILGLGVVAAGPGGAGGVGVPVVGAGDGSFVPAGASGSGADTATFSTMPRPTRLPRSRAGKFDS